MPDSPARDARASTFVMAGITMVAFAGNSALCRAALMNDGADIMHPAAFTLLRLGSGAATLGVFLALRTRWRRAAATAQGSDRRQRWAPALALWLYALAFSVAYTRVDAGTGALLLFGAVQFTMFGRAASQKPRPPLRAWLGMGVAMLALAYMLLPGAGRPDLWASAAMAIAGVGWGAFSLLGRASQDPSADTARALGGAFVLTGLLTALWFALSAEHAPLTFGTTPKVAFALTSGIITSGLGYVLWYATVPRLKPESASVIQLSGPVIAAVAGAAWLGEVPSARVLWAAPVILIGIAVVVAPRSKAR